MPLYLSQLAYTPEAWAAQLKAPHNRVDAVQPMLAKLGARVVSFYYAFGEYDIVTIIEAPDNVTAEALVLTVLASGACKAAKTTPLMTVEEGLAAMRKGAEAAALYRAPTAAVSV